MKHFWKESDKIIALLKNNPAKVLLLDFDGTLTPIVETPEKAKLLKETRKLLENLSQKPLVYLGIISGRQLEDLKGKIGLKNVIYGGNNGLEGEILNEKYFFPVKRETMKVLKVIRRELDQIANKFKGVFTEDKGSMLSFNYRMVNSQQISKIKPLFNRILRTHAGDLVTAVGGKKVYDILPNANWDKGYFAKLVIRKVAAQVKRSPLVITIGDDETDEDTFQTLKNAVTITVGRKQKSTAKYYLKNTEEVINFLGWINSKI